ncbi:uncharacterized protein N7483_008741 [Penicillium malachiteum]|uniref:uncharacterized protein n=1 Tax=Penicillium malachiteum TaxID=1324776 RepID=UPI002547AF8F|nr:uncharacterized protein N7483_008741 [Penicillium malachiteum]KAJ5720807.1 hypothetical protein N7483_008741 [Penicillium malachiteum]
MSPKHNIRYATESDVPDLNKVNVLSFQSRRSRTAIFPNASLPVLKEYKSLNCIKSLANPSLHVTAIEDSDPNLSTSEDPSLAIESDNLKIEVVAYARWLIPEILGDGPHIVHLSPHGHELAAAAETPLQYAPRPMNEDLYNASRALYGQARKKYLDERDIGPRLCTSRMGYRKADALQARIYLEATPEGVALYTRYGWKPIEDFKLNLKLYGVAGEEVFTVMVREPKLAA